MTDDNGVIHRFTGEWGNTLNWDGQRSRQYNTAEVSGVTETWLIGKPENAKNFAMRCYEVGPGQATRQEKHHHDHGILVLHGQGKVQLGQDSHPIRQGDVIYIPPDMEHQLTNTGQEPLGFICVIPANRQKQGKTVWADEGITFNQE